MSLSLSDCQQSSSTLNDMIVQTFQKASTPAKQVKDHSLPFPEPKKVVEIESALISLVIFGKYILEVLRLEAPFVVISHRVTAMLVLVDFVEINTKEWVGEESWQRWVGEGGIDDQGSNEREQRTPAPLPTSVICITRPNDPVTIRVPIHAMLLDDSLMLMCGSPIILFSPIGLFLGHRDVSSRSARVGEDGIRRR